jgi:tetratricopeptide (TPR) repeat protein
VPRTRGQCWIRARTCALAGLVAAGEARAQTGGATLREASGAAGTRGEPAPGTVESEPEVAEAARRMFREGAQLANAERWAEARDRFRRALALRPSPLLRFNLAVAAQNSGHLVEALDQYRQFLRDDSDPANALRRQEAQNAIHAIEPVLARVTITVQGAEPVQLRLDGRALPLALLGVEVPIDPGEHVFEADGPDGATARASLALGEGESRAVTLAMRRPAPATTASDGAAPRAPTPQPPPARREAVAPMSTIERVRRAIEEQAAAADASGERRWQRTLVLYGSVGIGSPSGLFGLGLRWAARPWFEFQVDAGAGHPFGPGVQLAISGRIPWSYQYATGLLLGFGTNFTVVEQGTPPAEDPGRRCSARSPFTPVWFVAGISNEWRVAPSFTVRLSGGLRHLFNRTELQAALDTHCQPVRVLTGAWEHFFDPPLADRESVPLLPWMMVDLGWVPAL